MYSFKLYFLHYTTFRCKMQVSEINNYEKNEKYGKIRKKQDVRSYVLK